MASNLFVYSLTLMFLQNDVSTTINRTHTSIFGFVAGITCMVGAIFSLIFHLNIKEPKRMNNLSDQIHILTSDEKVNQKANYGSNHVSIISDLLHNKYEIKHQNIVNEDQLRRKPILWKDWLKNPLFWKIGTVYMSCRLYFNLTQIYMPLYLQFSLKLSKVRNLNH